MDLAVGGNEARIGPIERDIVIAAGLAPDGDLVDVGCGSGRLAAYLTDHLRGGSYLGTDVVPELLEYARGRVPAHWRFELVEDLVIPAPDASADMVTMFSVLTHLRHEESYLLLAEAKRVLRPGGRIVVSFLEFGAPAHWKVFDVMLQARGTLPHLNQFIEAASLRVWAEHLGLAVERIASPPEPFRPEIPLLGQSVIVLRA
jgi:ubiquinone/menaquinone biosynthesis C-methylase UbiE